MVLTKYVDQVLRSFPGGSEAFFNIVWATNISSYDSLEPQLLVRGPPRSFIRANGSTVLDFPVFLTSFLSGAGIPCPTLFAEAQPHFSNVIDLSRVDDAGFRSRMFCWATTGSPSLAPGSGSITVRRHRVQVVAAVLLTLLRSGLVC
jgi:hypothetical protein